jgi:hypothetical protein
MGFVVNEGGIVAKPERGRLAAQRDGLILSCRDMTVMRDKLVYRDKRDRIEFSRSDSEFRAQQRVNVIVYLNSSYKLNRGTSGDRSSRWYEE